MSNGEVTDELPAEEVAAKWLEIAPGIEKMAQRIQDLDDFPVSRGSSLSGDDKHSAPYCVSHAVRSCLVSGVDHLHAAKSLVVDLQVLHASAVYSLIRGSLENLAAAYWMLHPTRRNDRIERTLRWHAKNFKDQATALQPVGLADESTREAKLTKLDAIAVQRGIAASDVRSGYFSSAAVRYVNKHSPISAPLLPWQVCSGFAYGRPWAVLGMSEQEQHESTDPTIVNLRLTSDLSRVLYPTLSAFRLMAEVVGLFQERSSPTIAIQR